MNRRLSALLLLAAGAGAQINQDTPLSAGPTGLQPASLLIFPLVDSRPGTETMVAVTNVNTDRSIVPGTGIERGVVRARFVYVILGTSGCSLFDFEVVLSPGDTFSATARDQTRTSGDLRGWLYVLATDEQTGQPIDFDTPLPNRSGPTGLIGEELVVQGAPETYLYALPAISFQSRAVRGATPATNFQGYLFTDAIENGGNGDGEADFNGVEYEKFPRVLSAPLFLEQTTPALKDELVLFTPITFFDSRVDLNSNFYNNNESPRSRTFSFHCWTRMQLRDITAFVQNLGGIPSELNTGWFWIDPYALFWNRRFDSDPPVHGAFLHAVDTPSSDYWAATLLWGESEVNPVPGLFGDRGNGLP